MLVRWPQAKPITTNKNSNNKNNNNNMVISHDNQY